MGKKPKWPLLENVWITDKATLVTKKIVTFNMPEIMGKFIFISFWVPFLSIFH